MVCHLTLIGGERLKGGFNGGKRSPQDLDEIE
jgi:hypothetical protein